MVVGTVSSAGLPPGWQEVHAEGQVYYWCVLCVFSCLRAPTFFFWKNWITFCSLFLSLSVRLEPFREEEEIEETNVLSLSLSSFSVVVRFCSRDSRESC